MTAITKNKQATWFRINPEYTKYAHGILLAFVIYVFSEAINQFVGIQLLGLKKSPISTVMIAIILGLILGNIYNIGDIFKPGINFSLKYILRAGIICLGVRLSFADVVKYGSLSIPLVIVCIIAALVIIRILIKYLNISEKMAYLIAIGTAICGATAIVATAPVIDAKKGEITYAIANITIFGILAMFLYPYFVHYFYLNDSQSAGLFLGTAIHETAQVAGAGLIYDQQYSDPQVLEISTITKLVRNTFLIVMIPLIAFFYSRGQKDQKSYSITKIFPYFILGFLAMVTARTLGDELFLLGDGYSLVRDGIFEDSIFIADQAWTSTISFIKSSASVFLSMAMASLGLATKFSELKNLGFKPMIVGLTAAITVGVVSIITLEIFQKVYFLYLLN